MDPPEKATGNSSSPEFLEYLKVLKIVNDKRIFFSLTWAFWMASLFVMFAYVYVFKHFFGFKIGNPLKTSPVPMLLAKFYQFKSGLLTVIHFLFGAFFIANWKFLGVAALYTIVSLIVTMAMTLRMFTEMYILFLVFYTMGKASPYWKATLTVFSGGVFVRDLLMVLCETTTQCNDLIFLAIGASFLGDLFNMILALYFQWKKSMTSFDKLLYTQTRYLVTVKLVMIPILGILFFIISDPMELAGFVFFSDVFLVPTVIHLTELVHNDMKTYKELYSLEYNGVEMYRKL
ncbi:hypothetical protein CAEBREN_26170 [Caenorhabditis brenneri]|uniref:Uncharacterized protein n=1 Tax=Caenorhabditis brenneri TaxID=135651 RepID=G0M9V5_CAEBE|nr:hypothetical protein CAEBREN_26170 [Caenorhabditis brenneri]